jgi:hypothetical protein
VQQPTPNRGNQAAALAQVQWAVRLLETALPQLGAASPQGQAVMKAITSLSKHTPTAGGSPGVQKTALQDLMMQQRQQQPMMDMLRGQGGGIAGPMGGAPSAMPSSPTPQPPTGA